MYIIMLCKYADTHLHNVTNNYVHNYLLHCENVYLHVHIGPLQKPIDRNCCQCVPSKTSFGNSKMVHCYPSCI